MTGRATPPAGLDRRRSRRRASNERIRAAAQSLFEERGFDATTVDDIAAQADVAQKTFFNHFASKDALLDELARTVLAHFEQLLEFECKRSEGVEARLDGFFRSVALELEQSRMLTRDLIHRIIRGSGATGAGSLELARVRESFRQVVVEGRQRGEIATAPSLDFQVEFVAGVFIAAVLHWLNDLDYPLHERLHETARFLATALRTCSLRPLAGVGEV